MLRFLYAVAITAALHSTAPKAQEPTLSITYAETPKILRQMLGNSWNIYLDGPIDSEAGKRFSKFLAENEIPPTSTVVLNSPGGSLLAGLEIGRAIRRLGLITDIGVKTGPLEYGRYSYTSGSCFSACALAVLGGKFRYLTAGSRYGVHRFFFTKPSGNDADLAQIMSAAVTTYLAELDIDNGLFALATTAGKDDMVEPDRSKLQALRVINNGYTEPKWTIEGRSGLLYLKGERETVHGINKFIMLCNQGKAALHIIFDPQGRNDEVMTLKAHSLVIDGKDEPITPIGTKILNEWFNASYPLTKAQLRKLRTASSVGVMVRGSYQAPMFLGFNSMDIKQGSEKLGSVMRSCS
jgi:hypothetical protein